MRSALEIEAARHALGLATGRDFARAAEAALLSGVESESTILLSAESDPILSDAKPLFLSALRELGIPVPEEGDAVWILLRHHMQRIVSREVSPREGVRTIVNEEFTRGRLFEKTLRHVGDSHDLHDLLGWFHSIDDIEERPQEVSCEGKFGAEAVAAVEAKLHECAVEWLSKHGD